MKALNIAESQEPIGSEKIIVAKLQSHLFIIGPTFFTIFQPLQKSY